MDEGHHGMDCVEYETEFGRQHEQWAKTRVERKVRDNSCVGIAMKMFIFPADRVNSSSTTASCERNVTERRRCDGVEVDITKYIRRPEGTFTCAKDWRTNSTDSDPEG
jgi:hypothetical protein